ncbi:MAG: hypothetical protein CEN87_84 [Parcubacteria group bacterium Licking1014_1]|nr:MAG: hypothetical protein CEN87_84 [Parcubacteria group bacterium Licking1014_1]
MNPESFKQESEQKLYIIRDIEGQPNREELEIVREIEKKLSKHPSFIGLALFGSVISGVSTESSDIDLYVLCDESKFKDEKDYLDFTKTLKNTSIEQSERSNKKIQAILEIVTIEGIIAEIKRYFEGYINYFPETILADMSRLTTGKKIGKYRKAISEELHKLPVKNQREAGEKITESIVRRDILSLGKRMERIPELSKQEHREVLEKRKEMWQKRVKKVWGLEYQ